MSWCLSYKVKMNKQKSMQIAKLKYRIELGLSSQNRHLNDIPNNMVY